MDITTLIDAIIAGAAVAGTEAVKIAGAEVVKETTKDAYRGLKSAMTAVFGRQAQRAIEKIEAAPGDASARSEMVALIPSVPNEDATEIEQKLLALLTAFKADPGAKQIVQSVARIKLDVDAGGHVTLEYLEGAREIDVRAKAGGDFVLSNVRMDSGPDAGN